jgi:hypothetical protein
MDRYEKAALATANEVLGQMGAEPATELERGLPREPDECPIANTVQAGYPGSQCSAARCGVMAWVAGMEEGDAPVVSIRPDEATREFIRRFDRGLYPALRGLART